MLFWYLNNTMSCLSNKVSGAVNPGQERLGLPPTFQRATKYFVANPEVISVVRVQIILKKKKKTMQLLSPQVVVQLQIILSQGWHRNT